VERGELRWRLAVLVGKSAHGSESLRMRFVGGWRSACGGASVRVTAHAFGRAAGGSVWWVPEVKGRPPAGTTAWGEAAV